MPVHDDVAHARAGAHPRAVDRVVHDRDAGGEEPVLGQHRGVAGEIEPQQSEIDVGGADVGAQVQRHQPNVLDAHVQRRAGRHAAQLETATRVARRQGSAVHGDALDLPRARGRERAVFERQRAVGDAEPVDRHRRHRAPRGGPLEQIGDVEACG